MKHLFRRHAILLAALLQVLPVMRNFVANPAATSTFAIIMRWTIGSTAALGAYDAFSASSLPYFKPLQTNVVLTLGTFYTNNIYVTNTGTDPGAYFELTNKAGLDSGQIGGGSTTTVCLPPGITLKCFDTASTHSIRAAIYGTPSALMTTTKVCVDAGFSGAGDIYTNIFFTVIGGLVAPSITNQPVSFTNVVGGDATFSVTAGGTAPLSYQWFVNTTTSLLNATNSTLSLANIQVTDAGAYTVIITNSGGAITSSPAQLVVLVPPAITNQPVSVINVAGGTASFTVLAGGTAPMSYQWRLFGTNDLAGETGSTLSLSNIRVSQAGDYAVVITNVAGAITSSVAQLVVTLPPAPTLTGSTAGQGNVFRFTFTPVVGLTNSVETNSTVSGSAWSALTNVPPPASASSITVTDSISGAARFYRVKIAP